MPDDTMTVSIEGLEELEKALESLSGTESRKIVRAGLYAGSVSIVTSMTQAGSSVPGEPGQMLGDKSHWSKSTRMTRGDELAGVVHVKPKGALSEEHTGTGNPKFVYQPKGKKYKRSLAYLVKLMELGGSGGRYTGSRFPIMTSTFSSNKETYIERVIAVIRERLKL